MSIYRYPLLSSICVGLLLALNFYMYFFFYSSPSFEWISLSYQVHNYFETAILFFTIGFVVSAIISILIGWPLYWLARKYSLMNYGTCALGGAAVTVVPFVLCVYLGWNIPSVATRPGATVLFVLVFCGASGGVVFRRLVRFSEKNT